MIVLAIILILIGLVFSIIGYVTLFGDNYIDFTTYLYAFGGTLVTILGLFIFTKTEQYEDLKLNVEEKKLQSRFKRFVKKYQPIEHYNNPARQDLYRFYKTKYTKINYHAILCMDFDIPLSNDYYKALEKRYVSVTINDCFEEIRKLGFGFEDKLKTLKNLANKGNNDARVKLYLIYNYGVKKEKESLYIERDVELAHKYLNLAIKDKYCNAFEQLVWEAYEAKDVKKAFELIDKYNLKDTHIHYTMLTYNYFYGHLDPIDYNKALKYAKKMNLSPTKIKTLCDCYEKLHQPSYALEIYKDYSDLNNDYAKYKYGELLTNQFGQHKKAFKIFKNAYKKYPNNLDILFRLAYAYQNGLGCKKDINKAIEYYKILVDKNYAVAINNLAVIYEKEKTSDKKEIFNLYMKSAELGDATAMSNIAKFYEFGTYVDKNYKKAFEYYKKSADLKDPFGIAGLGNCYVFGIGVEKDIKKAIQILKTAEYHELIQYNLALIYFYDLKSYNLALEWAVNFEQTIKRKNILESYKNQYKTIAFIIGYVNSTKGNYNTAMDYYMKSANLGHATAMHNIGVLYENGHGVEINYEKAKYWYDKAIKNGYKEKK